MLNMFMSTFFYILHDPDKPNVTKIGITKDPTQRLKTYRTAAPRCSFLKVYEIPHRIHEKRILEIMKDTFIVEREVVRCDSGIVKNIVDDYITDLYGDNYLKEY